MYNGTLKRHSQDQNKWQVLRMAPSKRRTDCLPLPHSQVSSNLQCHYYGNPTRMRCDCLGNNTASSCLDGCYKATLRERMSVFWFWTELTYLWWSQCETTSTRCEFTLPKTGSTYRFRSPVFLTPVTESTRQGWEVLSLKLPSAKMQPDSILEVVLYKCKWPA